MERLLGIGAGEAVGQRDAARERFDGLALAVEEQALEVDPGPEGGLGLGEVSGEQARVITQPLENSRVESWSVGLHERLEVGTA